MHFYYRRSKQSDININDDIIKKSLKERVNINAVIVPEPLYNSESMTVKEFTISIEEYDKYLEFVPKIDKSDSLFKNLVNS